MTNVENLESQISISDAGKNQQASQVLVEQALAAKGTEDFQALTTKVVQAQYGDISQEDTNALVGVVAGSAANAIDNEIASMEEKLNSLGDDAQLANIDLQNMLQKQQQTIQQMSNISKLLHDTAMAVIRKIG
jgi:hypothetical protein